VASSVLLLRQRVVLVAAAMVGSRATVRRHV
jgi:hypothetical protein